METDSRTALDQIEYGTKKVIQIHLISSTLKQFSLFIVFVILHLIFIINMICY